VVGFTVADFTVADSAVVDSTMVDSTTVVSTITGFSSVDRSDIPGGVIIRTMGITITTNPTRLRPGTTARIRPAIILM
jgi:hypothetical protein